MSFHAGFVANLPMQALWPMAFITFGLVVEHNVIVNSVADKLEKMVAETAARTVWTCAW